MAEQNVFTSVAAPALGAILANFLFLGPMKEVLEVRERESLGPLNAFLFPFIIANCVGWTSYGFVKSDPFIIFGNIFGIIFGIFYLLSAYRYIRPKYLALKLERLTLGLLSLWIVLNSAAYFVDMVSTKEAILSYGALAMALCMFTTPLITIAQVIQKQDSSSINRGFLLMQLVNCAMWATYAIVIKDVSIIIANGAGLLLGIVQSILVLRYPRNYSAEVSRVSKISDDSSESALSSSDEKDQIQPDPSNAVTLV